MRNSMKFLKITGKDQMNKKDLDKKQILNVFIEWCTGNF